MNNLTRLFWLHCLTSTHVGTGRGVGYIDLPLYRESITGWPAVPGSGFKGVWADHFRATKTNREADPKLRAAFGFADDEKKGQENQSNAGALIPTDARLVCLPVRSFRGTFAWATSPLALRFLKRDLDFAGLTAPDLPTGVGDDAGFVPQGSGLVQGKHIYLEDLDLQATENGRASAWAEALAQWVFSPEWHAEFKKRFVIVSDLVFDHLAETGTEVVTRVRIDDEFKTVADGQLWTEESLPPESILSGVIQCDRVWSKAVSEAELISTYATKELSLQIGGKASVGRGKVRCVFTAKGGAQ